MIETSQATLDNGLKVIHHFDASRSMVALDLLYNVGGRDEDPLHTGIAHLFEHLMFGGSANIPDFSKTVAAGGGTDNAWTSDDFTNFYIRIPAENAEIAFRAESDRMLALSFDPKVLEVQRRVVVEEFKQQCLDQPYGDLMHLLRAEMYAANHPYSWPVIGKEFSHIESVDDQQVRRWFFSHYAPNNAVLAVTGNISFERTMQLARKWFGPIPSRDIISRHLPNPGFPTENRTVTVYRPVPATLIVMAFPMAPHGTPDYYAADLITDLLSNGQSSRLYRRLMLGDAPIFSGIDASIIGSEHEGMLLVLAQMADESDGAIAEALRLIDRELTMLGSDGEVTESELQRTLNRYEFNFIQSCEDQLDLAQNLATAAMHGLDINDAVSRRRHVTVADIRRIARRVFIDSPHLTLIYRPLTTRPEAQKEA